MQDLKPNEGKTSLSRYAAPFCALMALGMVLGCQQIRDLTATSNTGNAADAANTSEPGRDSKTSNSDKTTATMGNCANEYYPVAASRVRAFKTTGSKTYSGYILTQSQVTDDGFVETRKFDSGTEVTNNWVCTDEGLRTADFTNDIKIGSLKNSTFEMKTLKSSGLTFPKELSAGKEWEANYDVEVNLKVAGISAQAGGKVTVKNRVASMNDKITADGKEYEAAKIESKIIMDIAMKGRKIPEPNVGMTVWLVPGVGIVRKESKGSYGREVAELKADN